VVACAEPAAPRPGAATHGREAPMPEQRTLLYIAIAVVVVVLLAFFVF
jgi:hypothetical protein